MLITPKNGRVKLEGKFVAATGADTCIIIGCSNSSPCSKINWSKLAKKVKINGRPAILESSEGSIIPRKEKPQQLTVFQTRVKGT
jgi:hypothetical protein